MIGAPVPEPFLVVDVDPRNGGSLDELEALTGPLPQTLTAWSGRGDGGRHLYFQRPPGQMTSTRLPRGIDLKVNGYCIVPPSIHPATGLPYEWDQRPAVRLTPALAKLLRPNPTGRERRPLVGKNGKGLAEFVARQPWGNINNGLHWAACRAAEQGVLDNLEDDLVSAAVAAGEHEPQARRTVASARTKITGGVS